MQPTVSIQNPALPVDVTNSCREAFFSIVKSEEISTSFLPPALLKEYPESFQTQYLNDCHEMTIADIELKRATADGLRGQITLASENQSANRLLLEEQIRVSQTFRRLVLFVTTLLIAAMVVFAALDKYRAAYCCVSVLGLELLTKIISSLQDLSRRK